ncbi:MAG: hypothetical protein M1472_02680 [Planctomycetes bacterium]|nr:hypothetical protein [Planctomycetota bacterium]
MATSPVESRADAVPGVSSAGNMPWLTRHRSVDRQAVYNNEEIIQMLKILPNPLRMLTRY